MLSRLRRGSRDGRSSNRVRETGTINSRITGFLESIARLTAPTDSKQSARLKRTGRKTRSNFYRARAFIAHAFRRSRKIRVSRGTRCDDIVIRFPGVISYRRAAFNPHVVPLLYRALKTFIPLTPGLPTVSPSRRERTFF